MLDQTLFLGPLSIMAFRFELLFPLNTRLDMYDGYLFPFHTSAKMKMIHPNARGYSHNHHQIGLIQPIH